MWLYVSTAFSTRFSWLPCAYAQPLTAEVTGENVGLARLVDGMLTCSVGAMPSRWTVVTLAWGTNNAAV